MEIGKIEWGPSVYSGGNYKPEKKIKIKVGDKHLIHTVLHSLGDAQNPWLEGTLITIASITESKPRRFTVQVHRDGPKNLGTSMLVDSRELKRVLSYEPPPPPKTYEEVEI